MKIFITGATGFIGRSLARRLLAEGHELTCGIRSPAKLKDLENRVKSVRIYLEYRETIQAALKQARPDVVYHLAALVKSRDINKLRRVNVKGTENVLSACLEEGVKKVIYASSVAVVGGNEESPITDNMPYKATNPYGISKIEAEEIALDYRKKGLKIAILRPCMVYGPGEPHGMSFVVKALRKRLIPVFAPGDNRLHLVSVENVVDACVLCLSKEEAYQGTFLVADGEVLTTKEALNYMAELAGAKPPFVIPRPVTSMLLKVPYIKKIVSLFLKDRFYSIERLRNKLGYTPRVSVRDGLRDTVKNII